MVLILIYGNKVQVLMVYTQQSIYKVMIKTILTGALATTTYYRRTVTSGIYTDVIVIVPVASAPLL